MWYVTFYERTVFVKVVNSGTVLIATPKMEVWCADHAFKIDAERITIQLVEMVSVHCKVNIRVNIVIGASNGCFVVPGNVSLARDRSAILPFQINLIGIRKKHIKAFDIVQLHQSRLVVGKFIWTKVSC